MITRPLLAAKADLEKLEYPVLATPKLDGVRALMIDGNLVSRSFKAIPNEHTRRLLETILPNGIDGELMLRHCQDFNEVQSAVMSRDGNPDVIFAAFDYVKEGLNTPYLRRMDHLHSFRKRLTKEQRRIVKGVYPTHIPHSQMLHDFEEAMLAAGHEGIMLRRPDGPYKCGRSTTKQAILLKLKRFQDAEGKIIGFEERMHNDNELQRDEFGLAKRSHKKKNLQGTGTLGALIVLTDHGVKFGLGTGFDEEQRKQIWKAQKTTLGRFVKFKYQELSKDGVPRFPVFLGFRDVL